MNIADATPAFLIMVTAELGLPTQRLQEEDLVGW